MNDYLSVRGVPPDLKAAFRVACAKKRVTVKTAISALMEAYVKQVEVDDVNHMHEVRRDGVSQ